MSTVVISTTASEYGAFLRGAVSSAREDTIRFLAKVGEQAFTEAFESGNYQDRTGALRSSIGYGVTDGGVIVREGGFRVVGDGMEGAARGHAFLTEIASRTEGLALILVAGETYARYVADKGFNVIDSAERLVERLINDVQ